MEIPETHNKKRQFENLTITRHFKDKKFTADLRATRMVCANGWRTKVSKTVDFKVENYC